MHNADKARQAKERYVEAHPERVKASKRSYYERNRALVKSRAKAFAGDHRRACNDRSIRWVRKQTINGTLAWAQNQIKTKGLINITPEVLVQRRRDWDRKCECCGRACTWLGDPGHSRKTGAVVEHAHGSSEFRGFVCPKCNTLLAALEDPCIERARIYLTRA